MIAANEIRIGNFVLNPHNNEVVCITAADIADIDNGIKTRLPAPLTEDWLIDFGFGRSDCGQTVEMFCPNDLISVCILPNQIEVCINNPVIDEEGQLAMEGGTVFTYQSLPVHLFQNLYFYLVGEELINNNG